MTIPWTSSRDTTGWWFDGDRMTVVVRLPRVPATQQMEVTLHAGTSLTPPISGIPGSIARLHRAMGLLNSQWPKEWSPENLILAVQTGNRIGLKPYSAKEEIGLLKSRAGSALQELDSLKISEGVRGRARLIIRSAMQLLE
jgi:hypothetical protein